MENIKVQLVIELTNNTYRDHFYFTDSWNFQTDKYIFRKKNEKEVEVIFFFEAKTVRHNTTKNYTVHELPSEHTRKFQTEEAKLEILLDVISLSIGKGLRIIPDSYLFTTSTSKDNPITNNLPIEITEIKALENRFLKLIKNRYRKSSLIAAIRSYRRSHWNDDPAERIPKLYSALEQAYGQGAGGNLLSKVELKKIGTFLESLGIKDKKKSILINRLHSTPLKSINEVMVEKVSLMNENGIISDDEKRALFAFWRKARSMPAHGSIIPKRGRNIDILIFELESTLEALLYGELSPKMIHYALFKKGTIKAEFIQRKGKLVSDLKDYHYFAIRNDELKIYLDNLSRKIETGIDGEVYLVSPDRIRKISRNDIEEVKLDSVSKDLRIHIDKMLKKLKG